MPTLFIFLSSALVKHILHRILPLFMTGAVFKAGSGNKSVMRLM